MVERLFVRVTDAGEVYQEAIKSGRSDHPTVRAFVDAGAHISLVSMGTGGPVHKHLLQVETPNARAIRGAPGVKKFGYTLDAV